MNKFKATVDRYANFWKYSSYQTKVGILMLGAGIGLSYAGGMALAYERFMDGYKFTRDWYEQHVL